MIRKAIAGAVAAAALMWVAVSAKQAVQPTPGPGNGIVPIRGTVEIGNVPSVTAFQQGEWRVAVTGANDVRVSTLPAVALVPPEFMRRGSRYGIVWAAGERETVTVGQLGGGGWVRVDGTGGRGRWINVAVARSVEEMP